jgi:hypothetical protein
MKTREKPLQCIECKETIYLGEEIVGVQSGVNGNRGFVPLEEMRMLCSEECAVDYFNDRIPSASNGGPIQRSRRIP